LKENRRDIYLLGTLKQDPCAMQEFYQMYAPRLFKFALALLGDPETAEEAVQDTMLAVWLGAEKYAGRSKVSTWLFGICRKKVADCLRRSGRRLESQQVSGTAREAGGVGYGETRSDALPSPPSHLTEQAELLDLRDALGSLPLGQREALLIVYYYGFTVAEAAEILGIPEGTVRSRLYHAKEHLRKAIGTRDDAGARGAR